MSSDDLPRPLSATEDKIVESIVDQLMAAPLSPASKVAIGLAERDGDPNAQAGALRQALRAQPDHPLLRIALADLLERLNSAPAIVLIERVRSAGRLSKAIEGSVYIEEPDGRLRPANGEDLRQAEERFPGFIKNWKLPDDGEW